MVPDKTENKFLPELRTALDKLDALIHGKESPSQDDIRKSMTEIAEIRTKYEAEQTSIELRASIANIPAPPSVEGSGWGGVRKQLLAAVDSGRRSSIDLSGIERRAITSNGAGVNTAPGIIRAMVDGGKLRPKVSLFLGKNAQTIVPVFSPHLALPAGQTPGGTGIGADGTGVLAGDGLTLKPWYSIIAISRGALMSTDIEAELPAILSEAFGGAIDKAITVGAGSGNDMLGVEIASSSGVTTSQDIACTSGAAAAPNWADYLGMVMELLALGGDIASLAIIVHPTIFKAALAVGVTGFDPMKSEYLLKGTILGVEVILSGYSLTTLTAGSYVAVGGKFKHYALAIAQELIIDDIKVVGSDNITFQAWMYMQGKPLIGSSFRRLKTAAA
jgi:hypothetical protein